MEFRLGTLESIVADISALYARRRFAATMTAVHVVTLLSYQIHMVVPKRSSPLQDLRIMTNIGDIPAK